MKKSISDRGRFSMLAKTLQGLVVFILLNAMIQPAAHGNADHHDGHHHGAHDAHAPAAAQEILDCQPQEGVQVVTVEGLTTTLPQPLPPGPAEERTRLVLDLGEVPAGTTAAVTAKMSWSIEANDWDLSMEDAAGTELARSWDLQPIVNPPVEQVSDLRRPHCEVFTLVSINALHAAPTPEAVDSLDTVISVTSVKPPQISLDDCHMTLHLFRDSAVRLSEWIPDRLRYTTIGTVPNRPDQAFLAFWFYSCQDVAIDGKASRATNLSLVGVVVNHPEGREGSRPYYDPQFNAPVDFDHYLVWAHTDNVKLAKHLESAGMPVERVRSIEFQRPNEFDSFSSVLSSDGSYSASMSGHIDDYPHWHDNDFWHDDEYLGESRLRIQIGSATHPIADDWSCKGFTTAITPEVPPPPPCSSVSAEPGSAIESLLGSSTRDDSAAFNHLQFDAIGSISSYEEP